MPTFKYRAYSGAGDLLEGAIEAHSVDEAEDALFRRELTPFYTREAITTAGRVSLSFGRGGLTAAQVASFTREFATLEQADIPLDQSLRILGSQSAAPALRDLARDILTHVVDGKALSDALSYRPEIFNSEYVNLVREGETMGRVGPALSDLADMLEKRLELRAKVQSSLIYPSLLITLALVSTGVILGALAPSIAPILADNGKELPAGLQFIVDAQANAGFIALFFLALLLGALLIYRMSLTRLDWRIAFARFALRMPVIGGLLAQFATARFARTLGSMLKAGVPLLQGLESARGSVANAFLNHELSGVIESVRGGAPLSGALAVVPYLPIAAIQMISIGEETAQLGVMLLRVAAMFERQTQRSIERAMGLLTPTLTILIAAVVGGLIMTVMDAVLSINDLAAK